MMQNLFALITLGLSIIISVVQGHAYYYCDRCATTPFVVGAAYMGGSLASTQISVVVKRGSTVLSTGSTYVPGETLTLSLSATTGVGGSAFEVSAGAIAGGSCGTAPSVTRLCASTGSWTLPTFGDVTAQVSWSSGPSNAKVYMSDVFVLKVSTPEPTHMPSLAPIAPTVAPTLFPTVVPGDPSPEPTRSPTFAPSAAPSHEPTTQPTQTAEPTFAPTDQTTSYSLVMGMSIVGMSSNQVITNSQNIKDVIAQSLSVPANTVTILSASATSRRRQLEELEKNEEIGFIAKSIENVQTTGYALLDSLRARLVSVDQRRLVAGVNIRFQVDGFFTESAASSAKTTVEAFLIDVGSNGFINKLNSASGLNLSSNSVTVTSSTTADSSLSSALAQYPHSCKLEGPDTIYWKVSPDSTYVSAFLLHKSVTTTNMDFVAAGIVDESADKMVSTTSSPHLVYLYTPNQPYSGQYLHSITGYSASDVLPETSTRTTVNQGVTAVQSIDNYVSMSFQMNINSGVASDTQLKLGKGLGNKLMFSSGKVWPNMHSTQGFSDVYWVDGACTPTVSKQSVPNWSIMALLGLIVMFNGKVSPMRSISKCISGFNSVKRLHPTIISRWIGNNAAGWFLMNEEVASSYSVPAVLAIVLYIVVNVLVLVTNTSNDNLALGTGRVAVMNMWISLLPTSKSSTILYLTGIPFERCIKFHKLITLVGVTFSVIHLFASRDQMILTTNDGHLLNFNEYGEYKIKPAFGFLALIFYLLMFLMAFDFIRKLKYEIFYVVHQFWLVAVVLNMLHFPMGSRMQVGFYPGLLLQLFDKFNMFFTSTQTAELKAIHAPSSTGPGIIDAVSLRVTLKNNTSSMHYVSTWKMMAGFMSSGSINFTKYSTLGYSGGDAEYDSFHGGLGQYYFINVPSISMVEWHPFSVSEIIEADNINRDNGGVTFHIKSMGKGTFTGELAALLESKTNTMVPCDVKLRGPFGSLSINLAQYQHIVLIAGGIGITPMLPILDRIRFWVNNNKASKFPNLKTVSVIWVARQNNTSLFVELADRVLETPSSTGKKGIMPGSGGIMGDIEMNDNPSIAIPKASRGVSPKSRPMSENENENHVIWDINFHVTACKENQFDFNTAFGKRQICHIGRPKLQPFFTNDMQGGVGGGDICGVLCGPVAMTTDAAKTCANLSIDYHLETFGW